MKHMAELAHFCAFAARNIRETNRLINVKFGWPGARDEHFAYLNEVQKHLMSASLGTQYTLRFCEIFFEY